MDAETLLTVRTTPAVKSALRRLQGRLQAREGRKVTVSETLEVALASAEAQWPAGIDPQPDLAADHLDRIETTRRAPARKAKADAAA